MILEGAFQSRLQKALPYVLIVCGILGFLSSFVLTTDKIQLLQNPNYIPPCNINPIISCGSVMKTDQASVFGFANSLIGIAAFAVVTTAGVALLAGAKFKKWFWLCLNGGLALSVVFVHWLAFEAVYEIQALCPYCMVVWVVSIAAFWYVTLRNFEAEALPAQGKFRSFIAFLQRNHVTVLVAWYAVILALILQHFWYFFGQAFTN